MKAFPLSNEKNYGQDGMDLRDYFAGQIIVGFLSNPKTDYSSRLISKLSFELADEMMKAREL